MTITALEKAMKSLERKARAKGWDTDLTVYRSGHWNQAAVGVSYVEICIQRGECDIEYFRFDANGYDSRTWKAAKAELISIINKEIEVQDEERDES